MGRIKTQMIKRLSFEMFEKHSDQLSKEFEGNKKTVGELLEGGS